MTSPRFLISGAFFALWRRFCWITSRFEEQNCLTLARSLTLTSLHALGPKISVVYLESAFPPAHATLADQAEDFIFEHYTPRSCLLLQEKLAEFVGRAEALTAPGVFELAITTLVLTGISCSTYLLSLPLLATLDIVGLAPLAPNDLPTLCHLAVFTCF